jgi:superfamily II DNA or RNA helicase
MSATLDITLDFHLTIERRLIGKELWRWIRQQLTIPNYKFSMLKRLGKSTWQVPPEFRLFSSDEEFYYLPRGFIGELVRYLQAEKIEFNLIDKRVKLPEINFQSQIELRSYQAQALEKIQRFQLGVIVAPPGSGKTVMGLELIARLKQPALIIVHRKELLDQWIERAESFLGLEKKEIGRIGSGKKTVGKQLTVATIQTLHTMSSEQLQELNQQFGLIMVDECHHIPANTFSEVIVQFNPFFMFGLTATPIRKNQDERIIFLRIGQIISQIDPTADQHFDERRKPTVHIRETSLFLPFNYSEDTFELLSKVVIFDSGRNQQIVSDVLKEVKNKKSILILTERKEHTQILSMYLEEKKCEVITLTGDDSKTARNTKLSKVRRGKFEVLIATGQLMGEGVDISNLDCLFLVFPFSFEGKLIQYMGRIQRTQNQQVIYDYRDSKIEFLEKLFKKRETYYRSL